MEISLGSVSLASLASFVLAFATWNIALLLQNVGDARKSGIPYWVIPMSHGNPFWLVFGNRVVDTLLYSLPFDVTERWARLNRSAWEANVRYDVHEELKSDIYMTVAPGRKIVYVADHVAIADILRRKEDFRRDIEALQVLNVYGPHLGTTDGAEWQKHRKITAVAFTERNSRIVWAEALRQAQSMIQYWTEQSKTGTVNTLAPDAHTFSLNVLAAALFAKPYPFRGRDERSHLGKSTGKDEAAEFKYRESLSTILENIFSILIFGSTQLKKTWMPRSMQQTGKSVDDFKMYALQLISDERQRMRREGKTHIEVPSMVNLLVKACQEDTSSNTGSARKSPLSEVEIVSNLFVFGFAGTDTTAITLTQLLVFLAANPSTQDWLHEEIRYYFSADDGDTATWEFEKFAKLKRCFAVILETLRLCHPFQSLLKQTGSQGQLHAVQGKTYWIPPKTVVAVSLCGMQTRTSYWGEDAMSWDPARHISTPQRLDEAKPVFEQEVVREDVTQEFLPWAAGIRACPGKRFSQVELVAAMARYFHTHKVEAVPEHSESAEQAQQRLQKLCMTVQNTLMTGMKEPHKAGVRWVAR